MLIAFDVDGTLGMSGGHITSAMIRQLHEEGVFWGILSSRSPGRSREVTGAMGLEPAFIRTCRVYQRAEELNVLREEFPGYESYTYVADTDLDRDEALRASWGFCFAKDFSPDAV